MQTLALGFPYRVAVLGAGTTGSQIAAHFANAGIESLLFDLPTKGNAPGLLARAAIERLKTLRPPPLALAERACCIKPLDYAHDLERLRGCDLIIEAISETLDDKEGFYVRIAPYINNRAVIATATASLSINRLAKALPENCRSRFCGMQFFLPPRYRRLVELTPSSATDPRLIEALGRFLSSSLGEAVLQTSDTPGFVANRIAFYAWLVAAHHGERFGLAPDTVDALMRHACFGSQGIFSAADSIGLDILHHTLNNIAAALPPSDPWQRLLPWPGWLSTLLENGRLGRKTKAGIYRRSATGRRQVFDPGSHDYRDRQLDLPHPVCAAVSHSSIVERLLQLRACQYPQGRFLWATLRDVLHYSAACLEEFSVPRHDVDVALRTGFGWHQGPFETWQTVGWQPLADWITQDIAADTALISSPLPQWIYRLDKPASGATAQRSLSSPSTTALFESAHVTLWRDDGASSDVSVLSFNQRLPGAGDGVLIDIQEALNIASAESRALVLWHPVVDASQRQHDDNSLQQVLALIDAAGDSDAEDRVLLEQHLINRQHIARALRAAPLPVVGAVQRAATGYGCELLLHCDKIIAASDSRFGFPLIEHGWLPVGGGLTELARRASLTAQGRAALPITVIEPLFERLLSGQLARSALEAQRYFGFLTSADHIVMHPDRLLAAAKIHALALADSGYRSPPEEAAAVAGRAGQRRLNQSLDQRLAAGTISQTKHRIGSALAFVLCGGAPDGQPVFPEQLRANERQALIQLTQKLRPS